MRIIKFDAALDMPTLGDYEAAIQNVVDETAREVRFRDGVHLASYVASTDPLWAAQAKAFIAWRDGVWKYSFAELAKVESGARLQPTIAAFLTEIIPIVWP
nr:MAG TPA: hypothetical protein [Caudoviricetes sp.]